MDVVQGAHVVPSSRTVHSDEGPHWNHFDFDRAHPLVRDWRRRISEAGIKGFQICWVESGDETQTARLSRSPTLDPVGFRMLGFQGRASIRGEALRE